jgi:hypothetical protein
LLISHILYTLQLSGEMVEFCECGVEITTVLERHVEETGAAYGLL